MGISAKELLLSSLVAKSVGELGAKMEFWGLTPPEGGEVLFEKEKSLTLEEVLNMIDPAGEDLASSETLRLLYCLGWEFIWGQKPPAVVAEARDWLAVKQRCGLPLHQLEELWLTLMAVDTDMF